MKLYPKKQKDTMVKPSQKVYTLYPQFPSDMSMNTAIH